MDRAKASKFANTLLRERRRKCLGTLTLRVITTTRALLYIPIL